ncbi:ATP-binding protein [Undibacterium sp. Ji49W]|uniref:ATP-binding protein n=1 Tax=Undibacterium sp. Ji49W TaxID=3413040 RepID=UPI003BF0CB76
MKTIRTQLMLGLLVGALICTLVAGFAIYHQADHESNEQSDRQLKQIAAALPLQLVANQLLPATEDLDDKIAVQVWEQDGLKVYFSQSDMHLPPQKTMGHQSVFFAGETFRVYTETKGGRLLQISQPLSVRHKFAVNMALRMLSPLLLLLLALATLIYLVVGKALAPLDKVAGAVAIRSPQALQAIDQTGLPEDLLPIVVALNRLLARIQTTLSAQRIFVADAAHELRSPLTALKLQLQLAERSSTDELRAIAFLKLHDRLDRSSHLVHQLLTLARHEPDDVMHIPVICDLHLLTQQAVMDHSTYADSKSIDLGVASDSMPVQISGNIDALGIMLSNLVDNALRYTQHGGKVDVFSGLDGGRPILRVADNGPGIPLAERERVFDRFYRPDGNTTWGCGLGMSIVKSIADLHAAEVHLDSNPAGSGLIVTVRLMSEALHFPVSDDEAGQGRIA